MRLEAERTERSGKKLGTRLSGREGEREKEREGERQAAGCIRPQTLILLAGESEGLGRKGRREKGSIRKGREKIVKVRDEGKGEKEALGREKGG